MVRETTHPQDHRCGIRTNADRHSGAQHLDWNDPDDERDHGLQAITLRSDPDPVYDRILFIKAGRQPRSDCRLRNSL